IQIDNNIALADLEGVSSFGLCNTSFAPKVSIVNIGNNNANEISLEYGTTANHTSVTWNANLPKGTKATIALDPLPLASGDNTYYVKVLTINGVSDQDTNKNILSQNIKVLPLRQLPFTEDFESELDFETNWKVVNYGNDLMWQRSDLAAAGGSYALFVDNTSGDKSGEIDDIYGPLFHIQKDATLSFDYAYSLYTEIGTDMRDFSDTLRIFLDVECAGTPSKIFEGFGEDFTTRVPYHTTDRFIPTATEWRHLSVDLSSFEGKKARLILRNISDIENSLFIDNINLSDTPLSSDDMEVAEGIAVYPTLAQQQVEVICHVPYEVALYSSTGILMQTQQNQTDLVKFDISKYPDQLFIFQIRTTSGIKNFKIIKRTR
ncbi:MAG TPA: choice-of-anchor J domain-containing protein, partial [Cytophagales bacterium]|nr:choice-of-anchor J domain-containing protein [Cytophagales bacterium]